MQLKRMILDIGKTSCHVPTIHKCHAIKCWWITLWHLSLKKKKFKKGKEKFPQAASDI